MARRVITPLDPDSPEGKRVAERMSDLLAEIWLNILARRAAAEIATETSDAA